MEELAKGALLMSVPMIVVVIGITEAVKRLLNPGTQWKPVIALGASILTVALSILTRVLPGSAEYVTDLLIVLGLFLLSTGTYSVGSALLKRDDQG